MLLDVLARLQLVEDALVAVRNGRGADCTAALSRLGEAQRLLAAQLRLDDPLIAVEAAHEAYAIETVTAYLDGAERGDGFELLGGSVAAGIAEAGGDATWAAGVIAALARLSGDLAVLVASTATEPAWDDARRLLQQLARVDPASDGDTT